MRKHYLTALSIALVFISSCSSNNNETAITHISIESALDNPGQINASSLGKSIRYVALETKDSTTLIGANPMLRKHGDKFFIASENSVIKVFDANSGKYLYSIGEISNGPRGSYTLESFMLNPAKGEVFVSAHDKFQIRAWDMNGNFVRTDDLPKFTGYEFFPSFNTCAILGDGKFAKYEIGKLHLYNESDTVAQTIDISQTAPFAGFQDVEMAAIDVANPDDPIFVLNLKSGITILEPLRNRPFWNYNSNLYIKERTVDTAYMVCTDNTVTPAIIFDAGKYNLTKEERETNRSKNKRATINGIIETDEIILFQCYFTTFEKLTGLYEKDGGKITVSSDKIVDDINGFVPFAVHTITPTDNTMLAIIEALDVVTWAEENPDKKNLLPNVNENDNIVVAIIE